MILVHNHLVVEIYTKTSYLELYLLKAKNSEITVLLTYLQFFEECALEF